MNDCVTKKIKLKAVANKWISDHVNGERTCISLSSPIIHHNQWVIKLLMKKNQTYVLGELCLDHQGYVVQSTDPDLIVHRVRTLNEPFLYNRQRVLQQYPEERGLFFGDGITALAQLPQESIDLLLTDPPYSISKAYTCQKQIPRRLRKNGADFIMPKGDFGNWDYDFHPSRWTAHILPKVKGWAVIFCAHAQIAEYISIFEHHRFNAIGTFVWHKTNPVPFNHKYKLINAWEAGVVAKRPGTKFYGQSVHNVFTYKSPSPQQRRHPTQKPLGLIKELIELFSHTGELVADPFAGAGTTACGAVELGREVISFENNAEYYDEAYTRFSTIQTQLCI